MTPAASDLQRFRTAQGEGAGSVYAQALRELKAGSKQSHWIWFVLPQLRGLGRSPMAQRYGIANLAEAQAYHSDPILQQRLERVITVIEAQLSQPDQTLERLMGSELDAAKAVSSLTLFEAAGLVSAGALLDRIGRRCLRTLEALAATQRPAAI